MIAVPFCESEMNDNPSIDLLNRVRTRDDQATQELFERYVHRLVGLVRGRLSKKMARRIDPEDVVQSAYRSFFGRAQQGEYELQRSGDLWRLLTAVTINKLRQQVERHQAAKRDISAEQSHGADSSRLSAVEREFPEKQPTPAEAAMLVEEVEMLMNNLNDSQRMMVEMRLVGYKIEEIADELKCSERTVRRLLEKIKVRLEEQMPRIRQD